MIALGPADVAVARAVVAHADEGRAVTAPPHAPDWPHAGSADVLRGLAEHPSEAAFLVLADGLVVGECRLVGPPDADGEVELAYALAPSARGRGTGTAAVSLLLAEAARAGARRVRAEVLPGNEASLRLLDRLGFAVVAHRAGHVVLGRDVGHLAPPPTT